MGSELRYGLRKVLGTQNHPTLRLASLHCVLCFNPIKCTLNTASIFTHTHTHINTHLTHNMASIIPNHTSIMHIKQPNIHLIMAYHHITNPSIHLIMAYMSHHPCIHLAWHNINPSMLLSSCHHIPSKVTTWYGKQT